MNMCLGDFEDTYVRPARFPGAKVCRIYERESPTSSSRLNSLTNRGISVRRANLKRNQVLTTIGPEDRIAWFVKFFESDGITAPHSKE
jgi:hypothetical protein